MRSRHAAEVISRVRLACWSAGAAGLGLVAAAVVLLMMARRRRARAKALEVKSSALVQPNELVMPSALATPEPDRWVLA